MKHEVRQEFFLSDQRDSSLRAKRRWPDGVQLSTVVYWLQDTPVLTHHENHWEVREHDEQIRLEERELVSTKPTDVINKASRTGDGALRFILRPIREVLMSTAAG